jgi:hypothetical protein
LNGQKKLQQQQKKKQKKKQRKQNNEVHINEKESMQEMQNILRGKRMPKLQINTDSNSMARKNKHP